MILFNYPQLVHERNQKASRGEVDMINWQAIDEFEKIVSPVVRLWNNNKESQEVFVNEKIWQKLVVLMPAIYPDMSMFRSHPYICYQLGSSTLIIKCEPVKTVMSRDESKIIFFEYGD